MAYISGEQANIIRQEVYEESLLKAYDDWLVGRLLFNDRTGAFPDGDTLEVTKTGDRAVSDYTEDQPVDFSKMATSRVQLTVDTYLQDGFYITDKLAQDSHQAEAFWSENVRKSGIAFERRMETDVFKTCNEGQTAGDLNLINGQPHRFVASGTNQVITIGDIIQLKAAFDKALVPEQNRVLFIDPLVEAQLNALYEYTSPVQFNNDFAGIVNTGFGDRLNFRTNIMGFNIAISHHLPKIASETIDSVSVTNGVACVAMSMASADDMPVHGVMRQSVKAEMERNGRMKRDEWSATARYGFGLQRAESLGIILAAEALA